MKKGLCPKCGAKDIRRDENRWSARNFLATSFFGRNPLRIRNYACASCGYLESYIRTEDLQVVARFWERVGSSKSSNLSELE
jgi:predicted nucleic-acid-binding Zn-ribbon protein